RAEDANEFTVRGARIAARTLRDLGWPSKRVDVVAQAITVNANARVDLRRWGPEAYYARLAPVCDGLGETGRIPEAAARALLGRYPQGDLAGAVARLVSDEAKRQPGGRFALIRHFFPTAVRLGSRRWSRYASRLPAGPSQ